MINDDINKTKTRHPSAKKAGLIILGLFLLYVVLGFWVAPPIAKPIVEERLTDILGRKVTIATVRLNPLALSATTSDLTVHEMDGIPFAGFKELYVNVQLSSLFRWAVTVKEIRISSPFGMLRLMPGRKLNIDDLIAKFNQSPPQSGAKRGLPRAILSRLEVIDGKFVFEDLASSEPIHDVIAPITFTLENLSTLEGREGEFHVAGEGPIGGAFDLSGHLELNPFRLTGRFSTRDAALSHHWEHIKDIASFQIGKGRVSASCKYFAAIDDSGLIARLENGTVQLDDFELLEKGRDTVLIDLPAFSIEGIQVDLKTRGITIDRVQTADARIHSWLSADGTFAPQEMLLKDLETLMEIVDEPAPKTPISQPWKVNLKKMEVTGWGLDFEDRTLPHPAMMSVDGIRAVVENLSTQKDTQATVEAAMQINRAGQVKIDGSAGIDPLQAKMKAIATKIALKPFQAYVDDAVNAQIISGTISSTGRIRYRGKHAGPQIEYEGEFSIDELELQDPVQTGDLVTLAHIKTNGIALELLPNKLTVAEVLIDRPHARVTIDESGVINVIKAFTPAEKRRKSGEKNLLQRLVNFLIMEFKGPMPIHVDRVRLQGFTGDFMDASVTPTFNTHMQITDATVSKLSSAPSARSNFKFAGNIDGQAIINASGRLNPMNAFKYSTLDLSLKDFILPSISPYSGKYIGYKIAGGALHTDLTYKISDDRVEGDNAVTIDGLELGEPVNSPDAIKLPIKLGVTLLKDKNDRIALQVPVVGNVRDPRFDIGAAIKSALTGTIEKAGSEPFTAIGQIDGFTGKDLSVVDFDFGTNTLTETETQKLNALAKYLKTKNTLILEIVGTADKIMDHAAITGQDPISKPTDVAPQENAPAAEETIEIEIKDYRHLQALAQQRASAVNTYLVEQASIDRSRIHVNPVQIKTRPDGETAGVEFSMSVK